MDAARRGGAARVVLLRVQRQLVEVGSQLQSEPAPTAPPKQASPHRATRRRRRRRRPQVCDFGTSHVIEVAAAAKQEGEDDEKSERSGMGSPQWTAPEILRGGRYDERADSYSYGMLVYEVMARRVPYSAEKVH